MTGTDTAAPDATTQQAAARRQPRPRLDTLTGLRGLAAFTVFCFHAAVVLIRPDGHTAELVSVPSKQSIGFFFALSGFVLTWSVRPGDRLVPFWRRRFARVYPVYLVVLLVSALGSLVLNGEVPGGPLVASLVLVQAFVPDPGWYFALNPVGWTLSCEALMYLALPFFIRPLARLDTRERRILQVSLLASLLALGLAGRVLDSVWLATVLPLGRLPVFALGCTVAVDVARGTVIGRRIGVGAALAVAAAAVFLAFLPPLQYLPLMAVPFLLVLTAGADADLAARSSLLTLRPVVWFGNVSYCFYLVQLKIIIAVAGVAAALGVSGGVGGIPFVLFALALSTVAAWVLHRGVERPAERALRGRSRRVPPVTMQA